MLTTTLPFALGVLTAAASAPDTVTARRSAFNAEEVLAKTRAAYAALTSYADSGTVLDERSGFTNHSAFRTLFTRQPRQLLIDYQAVESKSTDGHSSPLDSRVVFWMENGDLQTWSSPPEAHETYPADGGRQVHALNNAAYGTAGISVLIPSHLYSKSGLASPVHATEDAESDGFETVNGRKCYRIVGVERWRYPSGRETGVRPITLWIDAETYLVNKVVQDTPRGMARGVISRRVTTIHHQANPKLEPTQFRFTAPAN